jgi:hypothetical protein
MEDWIEVALSQWTEQNVKLNTPATQTSIEQAEYKLGFQFPQDFKQLYLVVDGFNDYEWQEHMFSIWSLERIIEEYENSGDEDFIGFCDFLICSHFIGFSKADINIWKKFSIVYSKDPLSGTFKEIIRLVNDSHDSIY